jgi:hypothetical protein
MPDIGKVLTVNGTGHGFRPGNIAKVGGKACPWLMTMTAVSSCGAAMAPLLGGGKMRDATEPRGGAAMAPLLGGGKMRDATEPRGVRQALLRDPSRAEKARVLAPERPLARSAPASVQLTP